MYLTVEQASEKFQVARNTILKVYRAKDSPAFKAGSCRTSPWLCDEQELVRYFKRVSQEYKGKENTW